jgi:predicted metal-dependent hydrolase
MILFLILVLVNAYILHNTTEPREFTEVKEKYKTLRDHLRETNNEKFHTLVRPIPITGRKVMTDSVGFNVNKGSEITICLDGSTNEIFHVLIHELAHSTVEEYSHSEQFWANYNELMEICIQIGIYQKITEKTEFCGQHVQDK